MSTKKYIWGVRIYLRESVAQNTDAGIYTTSTGSEIRWIETDISSYSPTLTWQDEILAPDWLSDIEESADWSISGDLPSIGGGTLKASNTILSSSTATQLDKILEDLGINLTGLRCDIVRFELSGGALVDAGGSTRFRLKCGSPSWTETEFTVPLETARLTRRANILTRIDTQNYPDSDNQGKVIPASFGNLVPEYNADNEPTTGRMAEFIRTSNKETVWETASATDENLPTFIGDDVGQSVFPVVGVDGSAPYTTYIIKLSVNAMWVYGAQRTAASNLAVLSGFVGKHMRIIDGTGAGEMRQITAATVSAGDIDQIYVVISSNFKDTPAYNATATATSQSWVEFVDFDMSYKGDEWPLESLAQVDGTKTNVDFNAFAYAEQSKGTLNDDGATVSIRTTEKEFIPLPQDTLSVQDTENNQVNVALRNSPAPDEFDDFVLYQCSFPVLHYGDNSRWETGAADHDWGDYVATGGGIPGHYGYHFYPNTESNIVDRITWTEYDTPDLIGLGLSVSPHLRTTEVRHVIAIELGLPVIPKDLDFDAAYLLLRYEDIRNMGNDSGNIKDAKTRIVAIRRFGYAVECLSASTGDLVKQANTWEVYNSWRDYSGDEYFFYNNTIPGSNVTDVRGYERFALSGITDYRKYKTLSKIVAFSMTQVDHDLTADAFLMRAKLYKTAYIAFHRRASIKKNIFIPTYGRTFNDSWGNRKTSYTSAMLNPVDIAEHTLRLQDWSELSYTGGATDWGHAYTAGALINTSTSHGGFDYEGLSAVKDFNVARQVSNWNDGYTDIILKSLARGFFLTFYQDPKTGQECISFIGDKSQTTVNETVDLTKIVGPVGNVVSSGPEHLYAEPFVKYSFNNASGEFDKIIRINRTDIVAYSSSYISGAVGSEAEMLWTKARAVRKGVNIVEPPPAELTEHKWIYNDDDAVRYLDVWLTWQGAISTDGTVAGISFKRKKRIVFSVPYQVGAEWTIGTHIKLQLPHQTNNVAIEGVVEQIRHSITQGNELTTVKLCLYNYTEDIALYIQDTMDTGTLLQDWQDHMSTYAERGEGGADIQDI